VRLILRFTVPRRAIFSEIQLEPKLRTSSMSRFMACARAIAKTATPSECLADPRSLRSSASHRPSSVAEECWPGITIGAMLHRSAHGPPRYSLRLVDRTMSLMYTLESFREGKGMRLFSRQGGRAPSSSPPSCSVLRDLYQSECKREIVVFSRLALL
jgi:hypothetical protein